MLLLIYIARAYLLTDSINYREGTTVQCSFALHWFCYVSATIVLYSGFYTEIMYKTAQFIDLLSSTLRIEDSKYQAQLNF